MARAGASGDTPIGDLIPVLSPRLDDATIGAATYAARAWGPSLKLGVSARLVLSAAIVSGALLRGSRVCWQTEENLAKSTGISSRTVRRSIRALEASGHVERRLIEGGGTLPDGTTALHRRVVLSIGNLPESSPCGLRGALAHALNTRLALDGGPRATLIVVLLHKNEDGVSYPGNDRIAMMTGQSARTVSTQIRLLAAAGHLTITVGSGRAMRPHPRYRRRTEGAPASVTASSQRGGTTTLDRGPVAGATNDKAELEGGSPPPTRDQQRRQYATVLERLPPRPDFGQRAQGGKNDTSSSD